MNITPEISIVVPVYNMERYLTQCVESILAQTFTNWELLLVDDGSTDNSGKMCDEWSKQDNRVKVIHKENTGQADSRNIALKNARGRYIGFVDSDDWIEPNMYETMYSVATQQDADIVICGYADEYVKRAEVYNNDNKTVIYTQDEAIERLIYDNEIRSYLWDKLFRREILGDEMPKGRIFEDYAIMPRWFANAKKIVSLHVPLYHYRQRRGSTIYSDPAKNRYMFFLAEQMRCSFMLENKIMSERANEWQAYLCKIGVQEAKRIARETEDSILALGYIERIALELKDYPVSVTSLLKKKTQVRLRRLIKNPKMFYRTLRFSRFFVLNSRTTPKDLYEK